jgi:hypothetical protein
MRLLRGNQLVRLALAVSLCGVCAFASPAPASATPPLVLLTPAATDQLAPGAAVNVTWSGGLPGWQVKIRLRDVDAWTFGPFLTTSTPNATPTTPWTVPTSLWCNRRYALAIAKVGDPWTDGPVFRLKCDVQVFMVHSGPNFIIRLRNGAYPIKPLINPVASQTRNVPFFRVTDAMTANVTLTAGGTPAGPMGTWSPLSTPGAVGPATLPTFTFSVTTQTTIWPNQWIAQYTLPGTSVPVANFRVENCASEAMSVSNALTNGGTITALADVLPANNTHICAQ